jgi:hypothetical protein
MEVNMDNLFYAKSEINGRTVDLVLTEEQVITGVKSALQNSEFVCKMNPGNCWPIDKPEECPIWRRIFGLCSCKS